MQSSLKKMRILVLVISILIAGCGSTQKLKQTIAKGGRVGIVSNLRDTALFQHAGTTTAGNVSFYRRVTGLRMNALVTTTLANNLYRSQQFRVIPVYHATEDDLLNANVSKHGGLTAQYHDFLSHLIQGKNLNTVVLVTPGDIDFGEGQYIGAIWWVSDYGLFSRAFIFMQTNTVFAAYNIYVIDAQTYKIIAKANGSLQARLHGIHIAWNKGYAGVNSAALKAISSVLRRQLPPALIRTVRKVGLP